MLYEDRKNILMCATMKLLIIINANLIMIKVMKIIILKLALTETYLTPSGKYIAMAQLVMLNKMY